MKANVYSSVSDQMSRILADIDKRAKGGLRAVVAASAGRVALELANQTFPESEQQGQFAITNDIRNVWRPVGVILKEAMRRDKRAGAIGSILLKEGKLDELEKYLRKLGMDVSVTNDIDPKQHQENRNQRTGRTSRRPKRDVLVPNRSNVDLYAQMFPMRRVGLAAHGWVQASRDVRKRRSADIITNAGANPNRIPAFKDKPQNIPHKNGKGYDSGTMQNPEVTIENSFPGITRIMKSQAIGFALRKEGRVMAKQIQMIYRKAQRSAV